MKKIFAFIIILLSISIPSFAENIYISQGGTGDGTSCSSPRSASWFNTSGNWGAGAGKISGGDTVYLCGSITSGLTVQASGSSGNIITIDGASATLFGTILTSNRSYFTVQNITWASGRTPPHVTASSSTNATFRNLNIPESTYVHVDEPVLNFGGASYITVDGVVATPHGGLIGANSGSNLTFSNLDVVSSNDSVYTERDMIRCPGAQYVTLEKSKIHQRWIGTGPQAHNDIWQMWGSGGNYTLRHSLLIIDSNGSNNYQLVIWQDVNGTNNIYGNVFLKIGSNGSGAMISGFSTSGVSGSLNAYNNTFINKGTAAWYFLQYNANSGNTFNFKNNVYYNETSGGGVIEVTGSFVHQYNTYRGGKSNAYLGGSCASYISTGESCDVNPLFYDYANNDFRIGTNSPAYNTGTNLGSTYIKGLSLISNSFPNPILVTRPQTTSWDKGAYSYSGNIESGGKIPMAPSSLGIK